MGNFRNTNPEQDPPSASRFHKALVFSNALQQLPSWLIVTLMVLFAALTALVWPDSWVPFLYLTVSALNWTLLWALPRLKLSFGPDRPSALALALLMGVIVGVFGVLRLPEWTAYAALAVVTLIAFYSTYIEPFNLRVTHQTLTVKGLPADHPPLRLLHLGDLHLERITPRERKLNRLVAELAPDVIVFSGDFVNLSYAHDAKAYDGIREIIGAWRAPQGVYCVPGTPAVEPLARVKQFVKGLPNLRLLVDEWARVPLDGGAALHVCGLYTTHQLERDRRTLQKLAAKMPPDGVRLMLTHAPDTAPEADAAGFDLYVCGHTHGGQLRLPIVGALFTASQLGKEFAIGRKDLAQTTVYTTRGIGLEGLGAPRARFLCPPEIILWEIRGTL